MSLKALDSYIDLPFRRHISVNKCAECVVKQNISFLSSFPGVQLAVSSAAIIYWHDLMLKFIKSGILFQGFVYEGEREKRFI